MKSNKITQFKITIKELLSRAGLKGKLKFFDLGKQNTQDENDGSN